MKNRVVISILFICIAVSAMANVNIYQFNDMFTLTVSDILELRRNDDAYTKTLNNILNYKSKSKIIFQQKELSNENQIAQDRYCRIMIATDFDESGNYPSSNEDKFSEYDINDLIESCQGELAPGMNFVKKPSAKVTSNSKGFKYIKLTYIRTGIKGDVCVNICYFFNYKYAVKAIFSYRISEAFIWQTALDNAIESFSWNHPYFSHENVSFNDIQKIEYTKEEKDNNQILYGIMIGIVITLVLIGLIYCLKHHIKRKEKKHIESELYDINSLIQKKKIVSAKKQLDTLKDCQKSNLLEYKQNICDTEKKIHEIENEIDQNLKTLLSDLENKITNEGESEINNKDVDLILDNQEIPLLLKNRLKQELSFIDEEYKQGIIPEQKECYTKYEIPQYNNSNKYSYFTAPSKGTVVFPYRRKKVALRGYCEKSFEYKLKSSISIYKNYQVLGDVSILTAEGYRPYEPDISIVEIDNSYGIRVDIEIDEPYSGFDKTPIHYIGCGDEFRDKNLVNHGWIVIRFSERQIYQEAEKCINYIKYVISLIDCKIEYEQDFPTQDKKWTEVEAKIMSIKEYREKLLNHKFGQKEKENRPQFSNQTKEEKSAAIQVSPLCMSLIAPNNIDRSSQRFEQDLKLSFDHKEHIYLYNGTRNLTPVSSVINVFFEQFDSIGLSERIAKREGRNQCEVLEDWDSKGLESREIGKFLHSQIESYFSGKQMIDITHFSYEGEFININKDVSIKEEIDYFKNFIKDNPIIPFRSEWHIFDLELGIAGTIDLLCRNGEDFDIFDWKRSRKASPTETIWRNGINGLENIPDINFYHYAIQQNLYRHILEQNYGIKIKNMNIVILHPIFGNYKMYSIPRMEDEIKIIINYLKSKKITIN